MLEINEFKVEERVTSQRRKRERSMNEYQKKYFLCLWRGWERERRGRIRHFVFNPNRRREKEKNETFIPVDHWMVTTVESSVKSSGNHGNISSSTSLEQSLGFRRIDEASRWYFRGTGRNAALTVVLKERKTKISHFWKKRKRWTNSRKDWLRLPKKASF